MAITLIALAVVQYIIIMHTHNRHNAEIRRRRMGRYVSDAYEMNYVFNASWCCFVRCFEKHTLNIDVNTN